MLILGGQKLPADSFSRAGPHYHQRYHTDMYLGFSIDAYGTNRDIRIHLCFGHRRLNSGLAPSTIQSAGNLPVVKWDGAPRIGCKNTKLLCISHRKGHDYERSSPDIAQTAELARIASTDINQANIMNRFEEEGFRFIRYNDMKDRRKDICQNDLQPVQLKLAHTIEGYFSLLTTDQMIELQYMEFENLYDMAMSAKMQELVMATRRPDVPAARGRLAHYES